jgi:hypothetical protein
MLLVRLSDIRFPSKPAACDALKKFFQQYEVAKETHTLSLNLEIGLLEKTVSME